MKMKGAPAKAGIFRKKSGKEAGFMASLLAMLFSSTISGAAAQLAYSLILSFIPLVMFVIALSARIGLPVGSIYQSLSMVLPEQSMAIVAGILSEVLGAKDLTAFSLFSALSFIAIGCRGFMRVSNVAEGTAEERPLIRYWLESYAFALMLTLALLASLAFVVFGAVLSRRFFAYESEPALFVAGRYILFCLISGLAFSGMYAWANKKKKRLSQTAPGGIAAGVLWMAVSLGFGAYVNGFANYGLLFGSLGGVFSMLIWLYYSSYVLIAGICINAAWPRLSSAPVSTDASPSFSTDRDLFS